MRGPADDLRIRWFNRVCRGAALLGLLAIVLWSDWRCPTYEGDFPQFYMGGVMARHAEWDSLYPIPLPGSPNNPGQVEDSTVRPRYAERAKEVGIVEERQRYIQPPPFALFLTPLAMFKYHRAYKLWLLLLIGCAWVISVQAGRGYEIICGRASRWAGGLSLLISFSPLAIASVRGVNMSAILGALIGAAVLSLIARRDMRSAAAIVIVACAKYASLPLLPLMAAMRRWEGIGLTVDITARVLLVSLLIMTPAPFRTYVKEIAPTLSRPHTIEANQSLPSFLMRVTHHMRWSVAVRLAQWATFAGLMWVIFRRRQDSWERPENVYAGAMALFTWMLIFSPVFWPEYHLYLCPFWGWLLWEARQSRGRMAWVILAVALTIVPTPMLAAPVVPKNWEIELPEPFNTHMLLAAMIMLGLAVWRLCGSASPAENGSDESVKAT